MDILLGRIWINLTVKHSFGEQDMQFHRFRKTCPFAGFSGMLNERIQPPNAKGPTLVTRRKEFFQAILTQKHIYW